MRARTSVWVATLLWATAAHADLAEALRDYSQGEYVHMAQELKVSADAGDVLSARMLGWALEWGLQVRGRPGLEARPEEAARWYRKAADAGDKKSMEALGVLHATGHGVPRDAEESLGWFAKVREIDSTLRDCAAYGTTAEQREVAAWVLALFAGMRRELRYPKQAVQGNIWGKSAVIFDAAANKVSITDPDTSSALNDEVLRAAEVTLARTPAPPAAIRHHATARYDANFELR